MRLYHFIYKLYTIVIERISFSLKRKGVVFMYHNVGSETDDVYNVSINSFEQHLQKYKKQNIIRLENWESENNFIAITIDDVAENFYKNGFPLLKKYQLPFTIFVNVELLGKPNFITIAQLKEMASYQLCTIGSHGLNHVYFRNLTKLEKEKELLESRIFLEELIGRPVTLFAFPYGSLFACGLFGKNVVNKYYKYGFGTIQTPITSPSLLTKNYLPRINIK